MKLKQYQTDTLNVLRRFLEEARIAGPQGAYDTITQEPAQAARLGRYRRAYVPLEALPDVPYVCLRLPTGGGKTILGAHAVAVARDAWIEKDCPLTLWLAPTTIIRRQTVEALKNVRHPYRRVLEEAFPGRVRVFDIGDFTHIRPQDIRASCCVVVGTIQTLRVSDTEGRKVYAHNEEMEPHFAALSVAAPGLEKLEGGGVKFSFANLLHVHRPLMIVDEAHHAVTSLTREMQSRVNPCAVIELTATPRDSHHRLLNNILHSVTAQELKDEEMIKLPVTLYEHASWESAVDGAVAARAWLAKEAEADPGRIRPLALLQAQPRNQDVTVETLKTYLMDNANVPKDHIAVATGDQRELDGIDLFDPRCKIEYIITVEALKEGWDCSFAYVFCSVSRIRSAVAVEQLLGRVLRMPYATRRAVKALNMAYAFLSEPEAGDAARALVDKLVAMGFEEDEATKNVEQMPLGLEETRDGRDLFTPPADRNEVFRYTITASSDVVSDLHTMKYDGVLIRDGGEGKVEIALTGPVDEAQEHAITAALPEQERQGFTEAVKRHRTEKPVSPAAQGKPFTPPCLMAGVQGVMEFADSDVFMESHDWSLLQHSSKMDDDEFKVSETARGYEIDIDGRRLRFTLAGEETQLPLDIQVEGWTREALVLWLDRQVRREDIARSELLRWLGDLVDHLTRTRRITISALVRCKFVLARKIRDKIDGIRATERENAYQRCLFQPEARVDVSFDHTFDFRDGMYEYDVRWYQGRWKPKKHFLGPDRVPSFDGLEDGEECRCAQTLDDLPGVQYWVRNVARHPASFWLPTATGRFYPDFVALLNDGRYFVVEYKGAHIADGADTTEKRTIGELWERNSNGTGLFLVVEKTVNGRDVRGQLTGKIGSG